MIGAANKSTVYGIRRSVSKALTEETAACTTLESAEEFSLSSRQGRRGLGRGGSFFLWLACASAVGCPSPRPSPRSFLTGGGSWQCSLSCGLLSTCYMPLPGGVATRTRLRLLEACVTAAFWRKDDHVFARQRGHPPQPVSRCGAPRLIGVPPFTPGEPQVPLRQHQANAEMACAAPGLFPLAHGSGLRR